MSHVSAAVVVSWPATSRVNILSFNWLSVSLLSSSSLSPPSLLCFFIRDSKKSCRYSLPFLLLWIIESNMTYILSRAWSDEMLCQRAFKVCISSAFKKQNFHWMITGMYQTLLMADKNTFLNYLSLHYWIELVRTVTFIPRWKAVPGILNGKDANEEEMILKLARNFSCSSPVGSRLIIMFPITLRVNCKIQIQFCE